MLENQPSTIARFGSFKLDLVSGELCKYGTKLRLGEQPFQILSLLLAPEKSSTIAFGPVIRLLISTTV